MDLPESPQYIRDIDCYGTRRTSRYVFDRCMNDIIAAVQNFNVNGDPLVLVDIEGCVQEARYAFETIRQKIQQRKYPVDFADLWPYVGLPIHIVSDGLGVAVELLESRMWEAARNWPDPSDANDILMLVQFAVVAPVVAEPESDSDSTSDGLSSSSADGLSSSSADGLSSEESGVSSGTVSSDSTSSDEDEEDFEVVAREFLRVPRGFTVDEVHDFLRLSLMTPRIAYDYSLETEMHSEFGGMRYGPLVTEEEWQQVVTHEENHYKVNIIFVQRNRH